VQERECVLHAMSRAGSWAKQIRRARL
jgi:hypothetical protein